MERYGNLKLFVEVRVPGRDGATLLRLKMVHSEFCQQDESERVTRQFCRHNQHLPIARATWTAQPVDLNLNFVRSD